MLETALRGYSVMCYKEDGRYHAVNYKGEFLESGTVAERVIQAALDHKGVIYFPLEGKDGSRGGQTYWECMNLGNPGFILPEYTYLVGPAPNSVFIAAPEGYTGDLIQLGQNIDIFSQGIKGIGFYEQGTTERNWTALRFDMDSESQQIRYCNFEDIAIYEADVGVELRTVDSTNRISSNWFKGFYVAYCKTTGFDFNLNTGGIKDNTFINCVVDDAGVNGFKDVCGERNHFINCQVINSGAINDMDIETSGLNTRIYGGRIGVDGTYTDLGTGTVKT